MIIVNTETIPGQRPVMESAFPFVVGAYLAHAAYNTFAVVASGPLGLR
jgi:hypothetical protein